MASPSLFDAFQRQLKVEKIYGMTDELKRYYRRRALEDVAEHDDEVRLEFHGGNPVSVEDIKKSLYVRSAYRHDPFVEGATLEQQPDVLDRHAVLRLIDTDQTVQNNYQRISWRFLSKAMTRGLATDDIIAEIIGDLQISMLLLGEEFFNEVIRNPLDLNILHAVKRSPLGLDLYLWLTYKTFALKRPLCLTWPKLY